MAIGGVMNVKREAGDPLQDAFKRLSNDLANRAQKFYRRQGWL